ncbi:MAG: hypothetical protein IT427_16965 [Pirellulales bacterium]|nr:hypothetical protein [Pirellulales bacterium]
MMKQPRLSLLPCLIGLLQILTYTGCASIRHSDTARTGIEQLLLSSAVDGALNKVDLRPISGAKVFLDTQYLEAIDKNYILISLHQRLLANQCTLVAKAEDSDVVLEVGSGGVGTDGTDYYLGFPGLSLPPPATVMIPKIAIFQRNRSIGTAKLTLVAYDTRSKRPVINNGYAMARADHRDWHVLGLGGQQSGSVHRELVAQTDEPSSLLESPKVASEKSWFRR